MVENHGRPYVQMGWFGGGWNTPIFGNTHMNWNPENHLKQATNSMGLGIQKVHFPHQDTFGPSAFRHVISYLSPVIRRAPTHPNRLPLTLPWPLWPSLHSWHAPPGPKEEATFSKHPQESCKKKMFSYKNYGKRPWENDVKDQKKMRFFHHHLLSTVTCCQYSVATAMSFGKCQCLGDCHSLKLIQGYLPRSRATGRKM